MGLIDYRTAFFRKSGWLIFATVTSGICLTLVHTAAAKMDPEEYSVFYTLMRCILLIGIPAGALETIISRQTATAVNEKDLAQLAGGIHIVSSTLLLGWILLLAITFAFRESLMETFKIRNEAALWMATAVPLIWFLVAIAKGTLQGAQQFLRLGWVTMLNGGGRLLATIIIVVMLGSQSDGGMLAANLGPIAALTAGAWWTRSFWLKKGEAADLMAWVSQTVPLMFGTGAIIVLSTADAIFVQSVFPAHDSVFYMPAQMVGFAMLQFTSPLVSVMFPQILKSIVNSERTDVFKLTLLSTACVGGVIAVIATAVPESILRILYFTKPEFVVAAPLVPWFAWSMLILTLANVIVCNLLAHKCHAIVPYICFVTAAYFVTLYRMRNHFLGIDRSAAYLLIVQIFMGTAVVIFVLAFCFQQFGAKVQRPVAK